MLYYRRKILLALLEVFEGQLTKIMLQKYLFLFTRKQAVKAFDFVPYKYGCFSFQANQDISTLKTYGYVEFTEDGKSVKLIKKENYSAALDLFDNQYLFDIKNEYGNLPQNELIRYTYINFPFYAINSTISEEILTPEELQNVNTQRKHLTEHKLFTIGYEGITLEAYIKKLIVNDVKVLCDVRKNAYSQKYGFSKSQLVTACDGVGIKYVHIPDLGIESEFRQNLRSQKDYDILFDKYEKTTLKNNSAALEVVVDLLKNDKRVALTCFEKDPLQCHRSKVAKQLMKLQNKDYTLTNL